MRADLKWTFLPAEGTSSVSSSVQLAHLAVLTMRIPAMETGTTHLQLQTSEDPMSVPDAAATWDPVVRDIDATVVEVPCSDAAVRVVKLNPTLFTGLGRVRLVAVDSGDVGVEQDGQVVTATLVEF